MSRDPRTDAWIEAVASVAGSYELADLPCPLSVESDLMREGYFLTPLKDYTDGES